MFKKSLCLYGFGLSPRDVLSFIPEHGLESNALAVAIQHGVYKYKPVPSRFPPFAFSDEICIIDPNVANLMATTNDCSIGPVPHMKRTTKIFVPIANFDIPNTVLHWTLLILEKNTSETDAWFPPIHLDSQILPDSNSSVNEKMAERMASLIMSGVSSPSKMPKTILYPCCPQQKNLADCGIYAALGLRDFVAMVMGSGVDEEDKQLYLAGKKSIFFNEKMELNLKLNWSYDETVASEYRKELEDLMSESLQKM